MRFFNFFLVIALFSSSCKIYKRNILFRASKEQEKQFREAAKNIQTPKNYLVQKNDFIEFIMLTNKGEVLVDPTSEFAKQISGGGIAASNSVKFLVQADGAVELPILGRVKIDSLTLSQCDSLLSKEYGKFYQDPFIKTKVSNRRVFILGMGSGSSSMGVGGGGGGVGGGSRVFDLENENITLMELMARVGVPAPFSYAHRIKVIRGDFKNPTIFTLDPTRIDSFQKDNLLIQPNDIVYIEPAVRVTFDFIRDTALFSGLLSTFLTILLLTRL